MRKPVAGLVVPYGVGRKKVNDQARWSGREERSDRGDLDPLDEEGYRRPVVGGSYRE